MDESFGSVVDDSKGLIEIRRSCSKYVLSCKSKIIVEETAVSRRNLHKKFERFEEGIDSNISVCCNSQGDQRMIRGGGDDDRIW